MAPDPRSERAGVRGVSRPVLEGLLLIRMLGGRLALAGRVFLFSSNDAHHTLNTMVFARLDQIELISYLVTVCNNSFIKVVF